MKNFVLKYLVVFIAFCIATWIVWSMFDRPLAGVDDANIYFVYAKNFVNGYGFVYNVGGEKVEGFTSFLWVLICALVYKLSTKPELTLLVVNVAIIAFSATVILSYAQSTLFSREYGEYRKLIWPIIFCTLLITAPAYIAWNTIALMENAIWSTLLLLATIFVVGENVIPYKINSVFIPLSILLLLTRPESFLWITIFIVILLARRVLAGGIVQAVKEIAPLLAACAVAIITLTVFRLKYFGYPLPNTFYAKVSPSLSYNLTQGILYFKDYFLSSLIVQICVLAAVLAFMHTILAFIQKKLNKDGLLFLPIIAGIGLAAPVITGGDHFGSFRFYQNIHPILLLCLIYFVKSVIPLYVQINFNPSVPRWLQHVFIFCGILLITSCFVWYQTHAWISFKESSNIAGEFDIAVKGRDDGQFIREMFVGLPDLPSIGIIIAGGIKYTYPGEVIDLMGLNNLLMAHNNGNRIGVKNHASFEKETFYRLQPDIVVPELVFTEGWQYNERTLRQSWNNKKTLKGLYNDPRFLNLYVFAKIDQKESETDKALIGWFRKDYLNKLDASSDFIIERFEYAAN
ncbi:MAG: hypothetical protein NTW69_19560 [Chloroflexi bacterium]|nr:hypothetical protein [Chloroflexota bacterium]